MAMNNDPPPPPAFDEDLYNLPDGDVGEWLMPTPCQTPYRDPQEERFGALLKYMIMTPLERNNLPYKLLRPRGVQAVECKKKRHRLQAGDRRWFLAVTYVPHCRHNVKQGGNCPPLQQHEYPSVRE